MELVLKLLSKVLFYWWHKLKEQIATANVFLSYRHFTRATTTTTARRRKRKLPKCFALNIWFSNFLVLSKRSCGNIFQKTLFLKLHKFESQFFLCRFYLKLWPHMQAICFLTPGPITARQFSLEITVCVPVGALNWEHKVKNAWGNVAREFVFYQDSEHRTKAVSPPNWIWIFSK